VVLGVVELGAVGQFAFVVVAAHHRPGRAARLAQGLAAPQVAGLAGQGAVLFDDGDAAAEAVVSEHGAAAGLAGVANADEAVFRVEGVGEPAVVGEVAVGVVLVVAAVLMDDLVEGVVEGAVAFCRNKRVASLLPLPHWGFAFIFYCAPGLFDSIGCQPHERVKR
jgi:hypothetical protein